MRSGTKQWTFLTGRFLGAVGGNVFIIETVKWSKTFAMFIVVCLTGIVFLTSVSSEYVHDSDLITA